MQTLSLQYKTGFLTSLPFKIWDMAGNEFYTSDFTNHITEGRTLRFNMPFGEYTYFGSFVKLDSPVNIADIILPPKERKLNGAGKKYKIVFGDNPNKCTIFYAPGVILFDRSFLNSPLFVRYGIYFHELGHHFYKTEWKADLYATKKMLEYGFNPSQIGRVGLESLSNNSFDRKERMIRVLTKVRS